MSVEVKFDFPEWNGTLEHAIAVVLAGWKTEEERRVYQWANDAIRKVARHVYATRGHCDKCGHVIYG